MTKKTLSELDVDRLQLREVKRLPNRGLRKLESLEKVAGRESATRHCHRAEIQMPYPDTGARGFPGRVLRFMLLECDGRLRKSSRQATLAAGGEVRPASG
jgi:hypothetical protein